MDNLLLDVSGIRIGRRLSCDALQFFAGQQIHLLGPNGSGKSTLLAALADAVRYEGQIRYRGTDLKSIPKRQQAQFRAYLTQTTDCVPVMTVFQYLQLRRCRRIHSLFISCAAIFSWSCYCRVC